LRGGSYQSGSYFYQSNMKFKIQILYKNVIQLCWQYQHNTEIVKLDVAIVVLCKWFDNTFTRVRPDTCLHYMSRVCYNIFGFVHWKVHFNENRTHILEMACSRPSIKFMTTARLKQIYPFILWPMAVSSLIRRMCVLQITVKHQMSFYVETCQAWNMSYLYSLYCFSLFLIEQRSMEGTGKQPYFVYYVLLRKHCIMNVDGCCKEAC